MRQKESLCCTAQWITLTPQQRSNGSQTRYVAPHISPSLFWLHPPPSPSHQLWLSLCECLLPTQHDTQSFAPWLLVRLFVLHLDSGGDAARAVCDHRRLSATVESWRVRGGQKSHQPRSHSQQRELHSTCACMCVRVRGAFFLLQHVKAGYKPSCSLLRGFT